MNLVTCTRSWRIFSQGRVPDLKEPVAMYAQRYIRNPATILPINFYAKYIAIE